jgi:hypothetical protein
MVLCDSADCLSSSYSSFDVHCKTPAQSEYAVNALINCEVPILDKIFCHIVVVVVAVVSMNITGTDIHCVSATLAFGQLHSEIQGSDCGK